MIVEYQQCECPKIDETSFIEKLEDFLSNKDYNKTFELSEKSPYPFLRNVLIEMMKQSKMIKYIQKKKVLNFLFFNNFHLIIHYHMYILDIYLL